MFNKMPNTSLSSRRGIEGEEGKCSSLVSFVNPLCTLWLNKYSIFIAQYSMFNKMPNTSLSSRRGIEGEAGNALPLCPL